MRENLAGERMPDDTAPATQLTPAHADAIEIFAEVLAQSEEEGLGDDFYSRLCEGITRCTAPRRVVVFRYDSARRRILAAGPLGARPAPLRDRPRRLGAAADRRGRQLRRRPGAVRRRLLHARVGGARAPGARGGSGARD